MRQLLFMPLLAATLFVTLHPYVTQAAPLKFTDKIRNCRDLLVKWARLPGVQSARARDQSAPTVDLAAWDEAELKKHLGRPVLYRAWNRTEALGDGRLVGAVTFSEVSSFKGLPRSIVDEIRTQSKSATLLAVAYDKVLAEERKSDEIVRSALEDSGDSKNPEIVKLIEGYKNPARAESRAAERVREGIEVGFWLVTLKSGLTFKSELATWYLPDTIDYLPSLNDLMTSRHLKFTDLKSLDFYHSHPGKGLMAAALSPGDIDGMQTLREYLADLGFYPLIRIFAVGIEYPFVSEHTVP